MVIVVANSSFLGNVAAKGEYILFIDGDDHVDSPMLDALVTRIRAGELAADGMVLLENRDSLLPLENGVKVALFGSGQLEFSMGGTGSASVFTSYRIGAVDGLLEQDAAGRIRLDREVLDDFVTLLDREVDFENQKLYM